ncbi:MAG: hypothetical protein JO257_01970 [Deltaproteobacteria bacterium]|nr:hypothetical protein [Deltaproteobacteria bacterium]
MRVVAVAQRVVHWSIASRGAARRWSEREALVLAVETDTGATGLGEAAPLPGMSIDVVRDAVIAAETLASRSLIALDSPAHALALADRITTAPAARFAIETALLAAYAQHVRTSIAALVAAPRMPLAELEHAIVLDEPIATAARCIKIKVDRGIEHVRAIAAANPQARLRLDANRAWTRAETRERLTELAEDLGSAIDFVEEPCPDAHELLADDLPVRLALDESLIALAPDVLARALESPQLAALVLKPTLLGGFQRCLALAALAHQHGVAPIVSHTLEGPIAYAACHELARAVGADVPVGLGAHSALEDAYE